MYNISLVYDTRSGRIVGVHHGPAEPQYTWYPRVDPELHLAVLRGPFPECSHDKHYAVDLAHKMLVEIAGEQGVRFGFGSSGGTSHRS